MKWKAGRFGHWGSDKWGEGAIMTPVPDAAAFVRQKVYVSGYPDNRPDPDEPDKYYYVERHGVAQWQGTGPVGTDSEIPLTSEEEGRGRLGYHIPTEQGHSGSPVWLAFSSEGKPIRKLLAVHGDGGYAVDASSGVLLTPKVMQDISSLRSRVD